jgi:hypothetical protein
VSKPYHRVSLNSNGRGSLAYFEFGVNVDRTVSNPKYEKYFRYDRFLIQIAPNFNVCIPRPSKQERAIASLQSKARAVASAGLGRLPLRVRLSLLPVLLHHHRKRAGIVFIHIPKAAGTSIAKAIYGLMLGHTPAYRIARYAPRTFAQLPSLAVTRNPWDRAVSAYHFLHQNNPQYLPYQKISTFDGPKFRTFESFVEEWLVDANLNRVDHVFRPQSSYVVNKGGKIIVDHIGQVENMAAVVDHIRDVTGKQIQIKHLNASERRANYRTYYPSTRLQNLVGDLYRSDADMFNYSF